jgi:hypothetical protein
LIIQWSLKSNELRIKENFYKISKKCIRATNSGKVISSWGPNLHAEENSTRIFSPQITIPQYNLVVYISAYRSGTELPILEVKRQGRIADHSPPVSSHIKKSGAIPPLPNNPSYHGV